MWHRQEWAFLGTGEDHRTRDSREGSEGMGSPVSLHPQGGLTGLPACGTSLWPSGGTLSPLLLPLFTAQMGEHLVSGAVSRLVGHMLHLQFQGATWECLLLSMRGPSAAWTFSFPCWDKRSPFCGKWNWDAASSSFQPESASRDL